MAGRDGRQGVVLINVLVTLALASSVLYAMISLSDLSIARSQRYSDATQAQALIVAGENSLIAALSRDLRDAPESDNLTEPWAQVAQEPVEIAAGRFALRIEDAASRLNLNGTQMQGALGAQLLGRIATVLDLPPDVAPRILARLAQPQRPLAQLSDLIVEAGLEPSDVVTLSALVTVLPEPTEVNLNTAPDALIGVLTDNPVQANTLIGTRSRNGLLIAQDVVKARLILPPGVGFTSNWYRAVTTVSVGTVTQQMTSLIQRAEGAGGPVVAVVAREVPFRPGPPSTTAE